MRPTIETADVYGSKIWEFWCLGTVTRTLAAAAILNANDPPLQFLDTGGAARNIDLPAIASSKKGQAFIIWNTSAGAFSHTVRQPGGGATVGTVAQNQAGLFVMDGATWRGVILA